MEVFDKWLKSLKDIKARVVIELRIRRIEEQNYFGDHKSVGDNVFELRIHLSSGYRVYYTKQEDKIVFLLCSGDKDSQVKDIKKAKDILR